MRIYFIRHAEAEDGANDAARQLTNSGCKQSRVVGRFLAGAGVAFDAAFTSPLVRAVQTAELILSFTNKKPSVKLQLAKELLNEASARAFDDWLRQLDDSQDVLLVGHNPSMTEHLARLVGTRNTSALRMAKGSVAVVKWEPPDPPRLKLYLSPRWLISNQ